MDALQKATHSRDHKKTDLLLDLITGETALRELVRNLLAASLQAIVDQAECSGQPGLWQLVDTVFQHGITPRRSCLGTAAEVSVQRLSGGPR